MGGRRGQLFDDERALQLNSRVVRVLSNNATNDRMINVQSTPAASVLEKSHCCSHAKYVIKLMKEENALG